MARIFQSGFETGDVSNSEVVAFDSPTIATDQVRTGTYALKISTGSAGTVRLITIQPRVELFSRFYVYLTGSPTTKRTIYNPYGGIVVTNSDNIAIDTDRTIVATTTGERSSAIPLNTWTLIESRHVPSTTTSSADGILEVRINGTPAISVTNRNTVATPSVIQFGVLTGSLGTNIWFDDWAINDTTGSTNNSWVGEGGIVNIRPDADSSPINWSVTGATSHFDAIDDLGTFDTTTYISTVSKTNNFEDRWTMGNTPAAVGSSDTINAMMFGVRGGGTATQTRTAQLVVRDSGGNTFNGTNVDWNINGYQTVYPIATAEFSWDGSAQLTFNANSSSAIATSAGQASGTTFKPGVSDIRAISLWFGSTGSPVGNVTLDIVNATSGSDASPMASVTFVPPTTGSTLTETTVVFDPPVAVTATSTYFLRLTHSNPSLSNFWTISRALGNVTADATPWFRSAGGTWSTQTDDWRLQIYGRLSKTYVDGLLASAVETNTNSNEIRWTAVWASVDFTPAGAPPSTGMPTLVGQRFGLAGRRGLAG